MPVTEQCWGRTNIFFVCSGRISKTWVRKIQPWPTLGPEGYIDILCRDPSRLYDENKNVTSHVDVTSSSSWLLNMESEQFIQMNRQAEVTYKSKKY